MAFKRFDVFFFRSVLPVTLASALAFGQGGPPMVTDDPGTPGNGHWEINIAGLLAAERNQTLLRLPYFDINYGLGDRLQLKVETGFAILQQNPTPVQSGAGVVLAGVKYRFLDEEIVGVAVSTYPQFQFHSALSSKQPGLTEPGEQLFLPLEFSKTFGNWEVNPEVGYLYSTAEADELSYGVVLAFEKAKPWEPLIEVHANTYLDGSGTVTLLNLGLRYAVSPQLNLLAAAGHTVTHIIHSATELDTYLGFQLEL